MSSAFGYMSCEIADLEEISEKEGFETDEAFFRDDVARFEKNASENGIRVSVGAIYCLNGTMDMRSVINSANQKMRNGGQYA